MCIRDSSTGDVLAVPHPPGFGEGAALTQEQHEMARIIRESLVALGGLERQRRALSGDKTLSEFGRKEKLSSAVSAARIAMNMAEAELERFGRGVSDYERTVLEPPRIEKDDVVSALQDQELRSWVRVASDNDRVKLMDSFNDEPRMLAAVLRSPVAIPQVSAHARKVWDEHVQSNHPDAPRLRAFKAAHEWAASIFPHIAAKIG